MIKKIYDYLSTHGFALMLVGLFVMIISGAIFYKIRVYGTIYPKIALGFAIAGIVIYVIGRFFVGINQQKKRASKRNNPIEKDDT